MQWYEAEVQQIERLQADQPAPPECVVFYGSSSIRLWDTLADDFPGVPAVNRAFGGSTMTACSWFFWRLVKPLRPRSLILYAGDNDLGDGQPPAEVIRQFGFLCRQIDEAFGSVPLACLSIKTSPARWNLRDRIDETNAAIRRQLEQRPNGFYIDVNQAMLDGGQPRRELYTDDGLHLSPAGYRLWADILWQYGEPLFGTTAGPSRLPEPAA
jgi:lysophospholipase L1-like esterase